jgi:hypothetical protein
MVWIGSGSNWFDSWFEKWNRLVQFQVHSFECFRFLLIDFDKALDYIRSTRLKHWKLGDIEKRSMSSGKPIIFFILQTFLLCRHFQCSS